MKKDSIYFKQAELLLKILPIINRDKDLALKGGTAINFFVRDFPRLSVDIDLAYIPIKDRAESLKDLTQKLKSIRYDINKNFRSSRIIERRLNNTENIRGIQINNEGVTIKIETNPVIRGSVFEPETMTLSSKAEEIFELSVKTQCLSFADIYGGKICAALDRQHPRDLFDIKLLLDNEGFTEDLRKAFIVYLISHGRPISELLAPNLKTDFEDIFNNEFVGMTEEDVNLQDLKDTFSSLVKIIRSSLTEDDKNFLLSFKGKDPKWHLLGVKGVEKLPSVRWKMMNLNRMKEEKHQRAFDNLEKLLMY